MLHGDVLLRSQSSEAVSLKTQILVILPVNVVLTS
jgi:hypothetical protein